MPSIAHWFYFLQFSHFGLTKLVMAKRQSKAWQSRHFGSDPGSGCRVKIVVHFLGPPIWVVCRYSKSM